MKKEIRLQAQAVAHRLTYDLTLSPSVRSDLRDELCLLQHRLGAAGVERAMAVSSQEDECE